MAACTRVSPVSAQSRTPCDLFGPAAPFPHIPLCAFAGGYRDHSLIDPTKCLGLFPAPLPDSIDKRPRTITVRFRRDRVAENRKDFGGYRIYRVINAMVNGQPDSSKMVLIRRYSKQTGDERTWNFSTVTPDTVRNSAGSVVSISLPFKCNGQTVDDSVVTFVDPDSSGLWVKICRLRIPRDDVNGRCDSPGDSIFVLKPPPGPHDGFRIWYAITYEGKNNSRDGNYADLFVPDTLHCATPGTPLLCPNLNHKLLNVTPEPVEPTSGPRANLETVGVVPNPYRAHEAWDAPGAHELHFINLPPNARILVYTVSGDLVAELDHTDPIRDFESWNLKNQNGQDVASGIYMYRIEASNFRFQNRFIVIR